MDISIPETKFCFNNFLKKQKIQVNLEILTNDFKLRVSMVLCLGNCMDLVLFYHYIFFFFFFFFFFFSFFFTVMEVIWNFFHQANLQGMGEKNKYRLSALCY